MVNFGNPGTSDRPRPFPVPTLRPDSENIRISKVAGERRYEFVVQTEVIVKQHQDLLLASCKKSVVAEEILVGWGWDVLDPRIALPDASAVSVSLQGCVV
jgi:hypothetical protein